MAASLYAGNAGAGIVPATVARTYQVVDGTTNGPNFSSTKVKLSDYLRGGTAYWTGSFPTTAAPAGTLVRTDARHVQKGPFNAEGLPDHQRGQPRRGQDRHLHLLRAARA